MTLKDLPPKLIEMFLALRAQILIRKRYEESKKHDETTGKLQ